MTTKKVLTTFVFAICLFVLSGSSSKAEQKGYKIQKPPGNYFVSTLAGTGVKGNLDGPLKEANFNWPTGIAIDKKGNIYVADYLNFSIRMISTGGQVKTIAGFFRQGHRNGTLQESTFAGPDNIAIDKKGNIIVGDADAVSVRKINLKKNKVTTIAGGKLMGFKDGKGGEAAFGYPTGVAIDKKGNIYVADRRGHAIRKIDKRGNVVTIAGNGTAGYVDGKGTESRFREPISLAVGPKGNIFVADSGNNLIRRIDKKGNVTTYAGRLKAGHGEGFGFESAFKWPTGIAVNKDGTVFVCDSGNNTIRMITPDNRVITIAGSMAVGFKDGPLGESAFNFPTGIAIDGKGNIVIADSGNNAIRKITKGQVFTASLKLN